MAGYEGAPEPAGLPLLPKLAFFFDFAAARIVGRIMQQTGESSNPAALLLLVPLLANILLVLKTSWGPWAGYARTAVMVGLFLYVIRDDLTRLQARQVVIMAIVLGYNAIYVLMVVWHASALKRFNGTGAATSMPMSSSGTP